jgi:hypothetical protein
LKFKQFLTFVWVLQLTRVAKSATVNIFIFRKLKVFNTSWLGLTSEVLITIGLVKKKIKWLKISLWRKYGFDIKLLETGRH